MNATAKQLYDNALQLSESDRAELAARLIESLAPEVDPDVDAAWDAEVARRVNELDSGAVTTVPWPEARRMILGLADESAAD